VDVAKCATEWQRKAKPRPPRRYSGIAISEIKNNFNIRKERICPYNESSYRVFEAGVKCRGGEASCDWAILLTISEYGPSIEKILRPPDRTAALGFYCQSRADSILTMSADSVTANITRFNAEAASWDSNVVHRNTCERACRAILEKVPGLQEHRDDASSNGKSTME
jgi:hypothetical protein